MEVQEIHHIILGEAADIANREISIEPGFELYQGEIFRPDPVTRDDGLGGLALVLDDSVTKTLNPGQIRRLHEIGRDSVRQALLQNREGFVGLIVGHARKGENYFDRFIRPNQQTSLF